VNFIKEVTLGHSYLYNDKEQFKEQCDKVCSTTISKNTANNFSGLVPFFPFGVTKRYKSQEDLIKHFKNKSKFESLFSSERTDIPLIRILSLRGNSFLPKIRADWYPYIYGDKAPNSAKEIIWGNINPKTAQNRKKAFSNITNYWKERENSITSETGVVFLTHNLTKIPFRMIFIGDYLFLSVFDDKVEIINSPVIETSRNSPIYDVCEKYYNDVRNNIIIYD
jgi:hypothetical protein